MSTSGKLSQHWPSEDEWFVLLHMDQAHFPRPWNLGQWQELNPDHHQLFFWKKGSEYLGFALFGLVPGDETAHLLKICLLPEVRGQSDALSFWKEMTMVLKGRQVTAIFLEVEEKNQRAQSFYKKVGFQHLRTVKAYYSDGENALLMQSTL